MSEPAEKTLKKTIPVERKRKPGNWLKRVGILSGVLWLAAIGAVFAVKGMDLFPANSHDKAVHAAEEKEEAELADVPAAPLDVATHDPSQEAGAGEKASHEKTSHEDAAHEDGPDTEPDHKSGTDQSAAHAVGAEHGTERGAEAAASRHGNAGKPEASQAPAKEAAAKAEHGQHPAAAAGLKPESGHGAAEAGNKEGARPGTEAVAVAGPSTEDERSALRELAEIHAGKGDLLKALHPVRKLLAEPTKDVALLSLAANVFLGTGNYQEALTAARKALRHAPPGRVDLEVVAIMSQYRLGEVAPAFRAAEAAIKKFPRDVDLLTALGTMEIEKVPADAKAGESLEKALKIKPGHVPALYQLGRKAQLQGDYKDAETLFRKVVKKEPKHAKAHGQLGAALYQLRKEEPARKEFLLALSLNPKDYNTWFNLGELYLSKAAKEKSPNRIREMRAEAMASYLKAVEWNPSHAEAHFRIGVILNGNGQFKEAIRHLEASRKVDEHHVSTWVQLAVAYENLKRPERAKECLEKALQLDPADKIVQFKLRRMS